jgi:hypothetical protein
MIAGVVKIIAVIANAVVVWYMKNRILNQNIWEQIYVKPF